MTDNRNYHLRKTTAIIGIDNRLERETALATAEKLLAYYKQYPERWIQHALSRRWDEGESKCGEAVSLWDQDAACFCIGGGLVHFQYEGEEAKPHETNVFKYPINNIARQCMEDWRHFPLDVIFDFNDAFDTTIEDTMEFLEHMITVLKDPQVTYA